MSEVSNHKLIELRLVKQRTTHEPPVYRELLKTKQNLSDNYLLGVEVIGAGYDIFGEFASAKSIKVQLFDWTKAQKTSPVNFQPGKVIPEFVDAQQQDVAMYTNNSGTTINKYQTNFSSNVNISGQYNLFSGSISNDFSSEEVRNAENEFVRIQQSITLWSLAIRPDYKNLRTLLLDDVRKAIDDANTEQAYDELFEKYGSHFLTSIIMGGNAIISSSTNKRYVNKTFLNETVAKASFQMFTGQLSTEDQTKYKKSRLSFEHNSNSRQFVVGGKGAVGTKVFSGNKEDFDAWAKTVGESPDFVNFAENPLTGIWKLCKDVEQANKMQEYFEQTWAPKKSKEVQIYADYIDALVVIHGDESNIEVPDGYIKIDQDLNEGADGDYIYLCYHKVQVDNHDLQNNPKCITDLTVVEGEDASPPSGYKKIDVDLNTGADGKFIYLCYRQAEYNDEIAIKGITAISGENADIPPPYGFEKLKKDLNADAGGQYIYVCYSKTS